MDKYKRYEAAMNTVIDKTCSKCRSGVADLQPSTSDKYKIWVCRHCGYIEPVKIVNKSNRNKEA